MRVRVLLDERAAGFFALGIARASQRATGVLVTSGTAAANLLPAVVEATLGRVPLVLLTADRPPELRDRGAPQTIDQVGLFGVHVKWFAELPLLDGMPETRRHVRSLAGRAVATACAGPAGPVHLNVPFREPLVPDGDLRPHPSTVDEPTRPFTDVVVGPRILAASTVADLAARLAAARRGVIVAGPQDDPGAAAPRSPGSRMRPASRSSPTRCPGLAAGRTTGRSVIARGDLLCRPGPGVTPTCPTSWSASGRAHLQAASRDAARRRPPDLLVVDGDAGWREPAILPTTFIHADATITAAALAEAIAGAAASRAAATSAEASAAGTAWREGWLAADRAADAALRGWLARVESRGEPFEGAPFAHLGELLPDGALLWAGSSMPVRDLDAWLPGSDRAIRSACEPGRERDRRRRLVRARRRGGRGRSRRARRRGRLLPPRPERARRGAAARPLGHDRPRRQRRRRHLLVPAAGASGRSRARACPSTTRSCSGRRTASTSGRSSTALGATYRPVGAGGLPCRARRAPRRGRASASWRCAPSAHGTWSCTAEAAAAVAAALAELVT